ncbi:MAG: patatin-like phospholipase family protein, partial [Firmicutes bacterium]|nr:patatin-like phospholipase family protein [Bacillota bacterium]
ELGVKIDCVFGTSVGALTGAVVALDDFELCIDIWRDLETENVFELDIDRSGNRKEHIEIAGLPTNEAKAYLKELAKGGAAPTGLEEMLKKYVDETLVRKSPIDYGLTTFDLTNLKPLHLGIKDIPEGKLHDFIIASCSVVPAIKAREIDGVQYIDGGYHDSVPIGMALEAGATDIISVNLKAPGIYNDENYKTAKETCNFFLDISTGWDLGNMLAFNKSNARRLMRLGYLDTMKAYGVLSGEYYAFPAREMGKRDLHAADLTAKIFELDPTIIYTKKSLDEALHKKIAPLVAKKDDLKIEFSSLKNFAKEIVTKKDGEEIVTILIAGELKKAQPNPLLDTRPVVKVLGDYITAARYLVAYNHI